MLASLKVASDTSLTNSRKDTEMDWNQVRERLNAILENLKGMNIKTLNISEDNITISLSCEEQEVSKQETVKQKEPVRFRYVFKSRKSKINHSRKKLKDPRWIKIVDTLGITPMEWLEREYPDLRYIDVMNYMYRHKNESIRRCCEALSRE